MLTAHKVPEVIDEQQEVDNKVANLITYKIAKQLIIFPVNINYNTITLFHPDGENILIGDQLRSIIGWDFQISIVPQSEEFIRKKIDEFYLIKTAENQPADETIERAILSHASDIHIVPCDGCHKLLFRIDGELIEQKQIEAERLIAVLKLKARLNVAESRKPQSGSFSQEVFQRKIDFRISTHPTIYGETLNVRILDSQTALRPLGQLGFSSIVEQTLHELIGLEQGMIILTGPTGSGKTTTLYSMLNILVQNNLNIMTIEDPVEYKISGIRQSEINPHKDLDYASGIKSILRQDPDVILIGEIRDEETAQMAFRAAITGHLVLTTLHTNDTIGAIQRLRDLGVDSDFIANSVTAVVAQRLVRKSCPACKIPKIHDDHHCVVCNNSGYNGRTVISELLRMNDGLRQLILNQADEAQIKSADLGLLKMSDDAKAKLDAGISTIEELKGYLCDC